MTAPNCQVCNITLPEASTKPLCDNCEDIPTPKPEPHTGRHLRVIHGGRDDAGIHYPDYHPRRKASK